MGFYIHVQETPNPAAVKFISQYTVKTEGKSQYESIDDAVANPLAQQLFGLEGVKQLFFFDNYITVTRTDDADWGPLGEEVLDLLQGALPSHDPNYADPTTGPALEPEDDSPEVRQISEILDRAIRPYLAADGGGIRVERREGNTVYVRYEGACGTCPSSIGGTLAAIQNVLCDELGEEIEVIETGGAGEAYGYW
ncbi:MAG: NifU family protein [Myxococcales bacterium]|nr:NifU family protein [Myxococcales bacterium]